MLTLHFGQNSQQANNQTNPAAAHSKPMNAEPTQSVNINTVTQQLAELKNTASVTTQFTESGKLCQQITTFVQQESRQSEAARTHQLGEIGKLQQKSSLFKTALVAPSLESSEAKQALTQILNTIVDDLSHPYQEISNSAEKTLLELGLSKEQIEELKAAQKQSKGKAEPLKFGASFAPREDGRGCTEPYPISTIFGNNSLEKILFAGMKHHLNSIQAIATPVFGSTSYPVLDSHSEEIIYLSDLPSGSSGRYDWA